MSWRDLVLHTCTGQFGLDTWHVGGQGCLGCLLHCCIVALLHGTCLLVHVAASGGWLLSIVEEMAGPIEMDTTFEDAGLLRSPGRLHGNLGIFRSTLPVPCVLVGTRICVPKTAGFPVNVLLTQAEKGTVKQDTQPQGICVWLK